MARNIPITEKKKIATRTTLPARLLFKMEKFQDKDRVLKAAREKQEVTYKGAPIRLATDFSMETLQASREWHKIFQVIRTRGLQ